MFGTIRDKCVCVCVMVLSRDNSCRAILPVKVKRKINYSVMLVWWYTVGDGWPSSCSSSNYCFLLRQNTDSLLNRQTDVTLPAENRLRCCEPSGSVCVCVCVWERESECVCVCVCGHNVQIQIWFSQVCRWTIRSQQFLWIERVLSPSDGKHNTPKPFLKPQYIYTKH